MDWKELISQVSKHAKENKCSLIEALKTVNPKVTRDQFYSARYKLKKGEAPKSKPKFTSFVAVESATVRITHPSGCVIECPISALREVLSTLEK